VKALRSIEFKKINDESADDQNGFKVLIGFSGSSNNAIAALKAALSLKEFFQDAPLSNFTAFVTTGSFDRLQICNSTLSRILLMYIGMAYAFVNMLVEKA
jgi:hypothetical protein